MIDTDTKGEGNTSMNDFFEDKSFIVKTDEILASEIFQQSYKDEFLLYTERNIKNFSALLVKRAREAAC